MYLETLKKSLDLYSDDYENITLLGYFNIYIKNPFMETKRESYGFKSLKKHVSKIQKIPPA